MSSIPAIVILVIILGLVEKFSKAAKRNRNAPPDEPPKRPVQRMPSRPAAPKPAKPSLAEMDLLDRIANADTPQDVAVMIKSIANAVQPKPAAQPKPAVKAAPKPMPMGASVTDDEGCVGGSLGAHSEEGESREEHARHELRRTASMTAETAPASSARRVTVGELRRAVVMSEILGKPKALRR